MTTLTLKNGIAIDLLKKKGEFLGLGAVTCAGVALRSGRLPMFVDIRSPYGMQYSGFRLLKTTRSKTGVCLSFSMQQLTSGPMEWQLHECRRVQNTGDWNVAPQPAPDTTLELELRPVTRTIGGATCVGFSYQYRYTSASEPIYMIHDRGTWELGGSALGNEFWMRNCFAPVRYACRTPEEHYSTEWFLPSCTNSNIFQYLPLQTELQGFAFQTAPQGTLITWPAAVAHVRSLFEKQRGSTEFKHLHEHCGDLALSFATAPVEVLFAPGARDQAGLANLHHAMFELVSDTLHAEIGMKRDRLGTYAVLEEWCDADLELYRREGLPKLLDVGCRTIYMSSHFQHNMNTFGVSNMCCTVDYKVAESVGEDKLRAFCQDAHAAGAKVEMWGNTSISTLTWIFNAHNGTQKRVDFLPKEGAIMEALAKAKQPFVRTTFGSIEADHYTPIFAVLNLREPAVRDYWLQRWGYAHDKIGLDAFFLDSSFNLSSDKFHYEFNGDPGAGAGATADQTQLLGNMRPAQRPPAKILSQYRAHLELMVDMQKAGYAYCNEDLGVFGYHRHGPGVEKRLDNLYLWPECTATFDVPAIRAAGGDPEDVYFRGLAYRLMWSIYWHVPSREISFCYSGNRGDHDRPQPHHVALLKAYNAVEPWLYNREILPGEAGVVYRHASGRQVLWTFRDVELPLAGSCSVTDVLAGSTATTAVIKAVARRVYLVG